jgi:hypothetical protein
LLLQQQRKACQSRVLLLLAARSDQNAEQSMHALGCCFETVLLPGRDFVFIQSSAFVVCFLPQH